MAEIHVIFPSSGDTIVHNKGKATLWNEHITWHIRNENEAVKRVRIEFKKGDNAEFFPQKTGATHLFEKDLSKGDNIWGRAPDLGPVKDPKDPKRRKWNKYTVHGLDDSGMDVVKALDPQIVNSDPNQP